MRPTLLLAPVAALLLLSAAAVRADNVDDATTPGTTAKPKAAATSTPKAQNMDKPAAPATKSAEAEHITIQHVLIGFAGSVPGKPITRTMEEAKKLAGDIVERAKKGEDFDALVKEYTDDSHPGIYSMSNTGVAPAQGESARNKMVPAFGDAGFPLKVGEVGVAEYDKTRSPYGWHVVKRLK